MTDRFGDDGARPILLVWDSEERFLSLQNGASGDQGQKKPLQNAKTVGTFLQNPPAKDASAKETPFLLTTLNALADALDAREGGAPAVRVSNELYQRFAVVGACGGRIRNAQPQLTQTRRMQLFAEAPHPRQLTQGSGGPSQPAPGPGTGQSF